AGADAETALQGFAITGAIRLGHPIMRLKLADGMSLAQAVERLHGRPGVGAIALNWRQQPTATYAEPDDPDFDKQWSHRQTEALALWKGASPEKNVDASKVIVAILDTGLDVDHPEFAGRVVLPRDFSQHPSPSPSDAAVQGAPVDGAPDNDSHGTHVAGIIGAAGHNGMGVAGVAWDVKLMPLKVLGEDGGYDFDILAAIAYALGLDANGDGKDDDGYLAELPDGQKDLRTRVISMSLGSSYHGRNPLYDDAFSEARKRGVLVVVAAGNDGSDVGTPANSPYCIAVSSTSPYQVGDHIWEWLSGYSNRGDRIDVAAPGGSILSTIPVASGSYATYSGTSMACPYVSGLAALVIARNDAGNVKTDEAFYDQVKQHLEATSDDLGAPGKDPKFGFGRVNVRKALTTAFPASLP
ncbi:MAG TPA: S8 family serine peptidase, partial [Stenomitos sp.]